MHRARLVVLSVVVAGLLALAVGLPALPPAARAATPGAGTVGPGADVSWTGESKGPTGPAPFGDPIDDGVPCRDAAQCDEFVLTVRSGPDPSVLSIVVSTEVVAEDFDVTVYEGTTEVESSAQPGTPPEEVLIPVAANAPEVTYRVVVNPYLAAEGTQYAGAAKLTKAGDAELGARDSSSPPPGYVNYPAPAGFFDNHAEPTIGTNHKTDRVLFQQGLQTARVTFDETTGPPTAAWEDVTKLETNLLTLDPIIETDPATGRTIVTQLLGVCSAAAVTDDDGSTWDTSTGCPQPHGADHQTLGAGPRHPADPAASGAYPHAMYYCSQSVVGAFCGESDDGGKTFGTTVPIYDRTQCANIHGQVEVAPDGTVYIPNQDCGGKAAVIVSEDGGSTWSIRPIPLSSSPAQDTDPGLGIASDGTLYLGYRSGEGNPLVAVSTDKGKTWTHPVNVGEDLGIRNATFPLVVAGDGDRAAFAFLATTTEGDPNDPVFETDGAAENPQYTGPGWHLYVSHTYDRGQTWVTSDLTPEDPVQRGCLYHGGGDNPCRDLLDFNDIGMDRQGRVLVAYTDGCLGKCVRSTAVADNIRTDTKGAIARLTSGAGLLRAFDGQLVAGSTPVACGVLDARGDSSLPVLGNVDTLDLVGASTGITADTVSFATTVADLGGPPSPFTGIRFDWTFAAEGIPYELRAARQGTGAATLTVLRDGAAIAAAGAAEFDENAETVTARVNRSIFDPGVKETTTLEGVTIESIATHPNGGGLIADTAAARCPFTIAGVSAGAAPGTTGVSSEPASPAPAPPPQPASSSQLPATGRNAGLGALVLLLAGLGGRHLRRRAATSSA